MSSRTLRVEASHGHLVARGERVAKGRPLGTRMEGGGKLLCPCDGTVSAVGFDPAEHAYVIEIETED